VPPELAPRGLDSLLRKLLSHSLLSTDDQNAIAALPFTLRRLDAGSVIIREGERCDICPILLSGFAYRHKMTGDGGRQIVALKLPGDPLDFQSLYLTRADHTVQALDPVELAIIPNREIERLIMARPSLSRAIVVDILIEASIGREWLLNIGRRNALARLAHLICEIHYRLAISATSLVESDLPVTQEQLADLLGLTPVHINRTLKELERAGAVARSGRRIRIGNLDRLRDLADFSDLYLHSQDAFIHDRGVVAGA
jgi:CRP-like cAMP-binding protein